MPFQVGSVSTHNDGQHIGSAKRNVVSGVAGLSAAGKTINQDGTIVQDSSLKNIASGIAGLDANSRLALSQIFLYGKVVTGQSIDTVYQNTSGRLELHLASFNIGGTPAEIIAFTDASNPPTTIVAKQTEGTANWAGTIPFLVQPGHYYKVTGSATTTNVEWSKVIL